MKKLFWKPLWGHVLAHIGTITVVSGIVWAGFAPAAEKFVERVMKPELKEIVESVGGLEAIQNSQAQNIQKILEDQAGVKATLKNQDKNLDNIKRTQDRILFEVRR